MKPESALLRYYVDPFGCVKNQVDAENMMLHLNNAGWTAAQDAADAALIIVNSCGFIESAKQESINAVLGWRRLYPGKKILLSGCLAQRYAKELAESLPEADGFFGTDDIAKITGAARHAVQGTAHFQTGAESKTLPEFLTASRPLLSLPGSAYVKISEGCDNRCTFCAIPLIRGPLRCRTLPNILDECKGLLARGVKELCIIGQDIGSYRSGGAGLPELLNAIAELSGNFWVRLLYIHPDHFSLPILDTMERDRRFLPYFDIPFQHASPKILSAMNRHGSAENYISLAETIRGRIPASVIRTTFLVGFPGETDADFASLLDFQEKLRPDWLGCFSYSREEGTPAYTMKTQVPKKLAARRQREIEERQIHITEHNMDRFVGQNLDILLEEQFSGGTEDNENGIAIKNDTGIENDDIWLGRLYCHAPEVDGAAVLVGAADGVTPRAGDMLPCRVIARRGFDLEVRLK
ncbi:MAG: 30S ribosomal protein S12 methylthiotransferase RimO [Treponema sp.]|nr:30S ribosomal protein S12 methylthiotransferase RimO [Treponema sp.]